MLSLFLKCLDDFLNCGINLRHTRVVFAFSCVFLLHLISEMFELARAENELNVFVSYVTPSANI